jgi:fumarylacetoacetate (FAA) hydrolase
MPQPLPRITSIRDFMVFEEHVRSARARRGVEVPQQWFEAPTFYFTNCVPSAVYGDGDDVPRPRYTQQLDYELELACVIGRGGTDIPAERAQEHVLGYTIFNDWSARDVQRREMAVGLGPCKGKDFAQSLGPHLVTPAELGERVDADGRLDLAMTASVNGVELSRGNAREMRWTFPELIAFASECVELRPGDVIGSGCVGTGCILELGPEVHRWLEPGDEVTLSVDGIGALRNRVA